MTNQNLIKQYVETGKRIPEYQFNKLSNNLKKTYLRKRVMVANTPNFESDQDIFLQDWEYKNMDQKTKEDFLAQKVKKLSTPYSLGDEWEENLKKEYGAKTYEFQEVHDEDLEHFTQDQLHQIAVARLNGNDSLENERLFLALEPNERFQYLMNQAKINMNHKKLHGDDYYGPVHKGSMYLGQWLKINSNIEHLTVQDAEKIRRLIGPEPKVFKSKY
jgi:hypothetical protein